MIIKLVFPVTINLKLEKDCIIRKQSEINQLAISFPLLIQYDATTLLHSFLCATQNAYANIQHLFGVNTRNNKFVNSLKLHYLGMKMRILFRLLTK